MLTVKLTGFEDFYRNLDDLIKHKIPIMTAMTLTELAKGAEAKIVRELPNSFDRPTDWTMKGLYVKPATPSDQTAMVKFKDEGSKRRNPAVKFMYPEVHGGERNLKRFEVALQRVGAMPQGMYAVPGEAATIDAFGNMDRGQIVQILSYFQAFPEDGYRANTSAKRKKKLAKGSKRAFDRGFRYFVGRPGGDGIPRRGKDFRPASNLPLGIWRTTEFAWGSGRVEPILIFVKREPQYKIRLPFYTMMQDHINKELPVVFSRIARETLEYHRGRR